MNIESHLTKEEIDILKERFEKYNHYCDLYNTNERFKAFVDKTCWNYNLHKDVALLHKTVQEIGDYYEKEDSEKKESCDADIPRTKEYAEDKAC